MNGQAARAHSLPGVLFVEDFIDLSPFHSVMPPSAAPPELAPASGAHEESPVADCSSFDFDHRLAAARDVGFAEGYRMAEEGLIAERAALLGRIETGLDAAAGVFRQAIDADMQRLAQISLCLLLESFPALCDRHGQAELTRMLRLILPTLSDEPVLRILVHPLDEVTTREEVAGLPATGWRVSVAADADMMRGDGRLTWDNGTAIRDSQRTRDDMLERLQKQGLLGDTEEAMS